MSFQGYKKWYATMLKLYPKPYRERFSKEMEQTFHDLCFEYRSSGKSLERFIIWVFFETLLGIIKENIMYMTMVHKSILRIAMITICILLVPFIAMQFTTEVNWGLLDFLIMGLLIFGAGLTYEVVASKGSNMAYRVAVGVAVLAALLLVWVNLAVGIIGDESNRANLMYVGVLAIGAIGALFARLQSRQMSYVLIIMALAQMLVSTIAYFAQLGPAVAVDGIFAVMWLISALFFRHASIAPQRKALA